MITHKKLLGEDGKPEAAVIPWNVFVTLTDSDDLELTSEEEKELREALSDSQSGNREAFFPADQV